MESEYDSLKETLSNLEARIARIEASLQLESPSQVNEGDDFAPNEETAEAEALEVRIGQNWFAKLGIMTLAMGVGFLLTLSYPALHPSLPSLLGYLIAGGIILTAQRWAESLQHISGYLLGGGIVLLFLATLRLHFFGIEPALESRLIVTVLLFVSVGTGLYLSYLRQSPYLVGVCLLLGYGTTLVADEPTVLFLGISCLSIAGIIYALRTGWLTMIVFVSMLNILTHLIWFLNNPLLGRSVQFVDSPPYNTFFVLVYMVTIAAGTLWRKTQGEDRGVNIWISVVNGVGGYLLFLFLTLAKFKDHFVFSHSCAALILLAVAILFWTRERSLYSTFIYVMLGYMALSVAIVAEFKTPDHFIWLSWQSIVVVSTAVWFRSRFIIVANFFIYLILFMAYLILAGKISAVSLSFGVVALLTARILNSQKHRLELKTELMRNAYLAIAFGVFPYALYHIIPQGFVSLSWLIVALFYYLMARAINSTKYRWMALLTLMLTIIHVLAVDIITLDVAYRVISFIVLGVVLLGISLKYAKGKEHKPSAEKQQDSISTTQPTSTTPDSVAGTRST